MTKKHKFFAIEYNFGQIEFLEVSGYDIDGECGVYKTESDNRWRVVQYATGYSLGTGCSGSTRKEALELYPTFKAKIKAHKKTARYQEQLKEFDELLKKHRSEAGESIDFHTSENDHPNTLPKQKK